MDIITYWFSHPKVWFNATPDDDLEVSDIFLIFHGQKFDENDPESLLANIILYDQMSRHYYRNNDKWKDFILPSVNLTKKGLENNFDELYNLDQLCFFLMPLRHSKNYDNLLLAKEIFDKNLNYFEELTGFSRKFYFHLIKELGVMKNEICINQETEINSWIPDFLLYYSIVDRKSWFIPENIYTNNMKSCNNIIFEECKTFVTENNFKNVCVSLSGGVDSMLTLCTLLNLRKRGIVNSVSAVHINYANRYKAWLEREFVIRFCKYHSVTLYLRDITEINRTSKFRSVYEDVTRIIRYDLYKKIGLPIFLGHNKTDCLENLITNIKNQKKYDNLYNMYTRKEIMGVDVCRPLLKFSKEIIESQSGFCHTKNSTYSWTERWKIRNVFIKNTDPLFITGLEKIKEILEESFKEINNICDNLMSKSFLQENKIFIPSYKGGFLLEVWTNIIRKICRQYGLETPTRKSIKNFVERLYFNSKISLSLQIMVKTTEEFFIFEINRNQVNSKNH